MLLAGQENVWCALAVDEGFSCLLQVVISYQSAQVR